MSESLYKGAVQHQTPTCGLLTVTRQGKQMCFKQVLERRCCRRSSDVRRQTVPRSQTSDGECPVAELARGAWNEEVTAGCRVESGARSDRCDWHT